MFLQPTGFWRNWVLSYVLIFITYRHFQTEKLNFRYEGVELELKYFLCIYLDIFKSILHKITTHLTWKGARIFLHLATAIELSNYWPHNKILLIWTIWGYFRLQKQILKFLLHNIEKWGPGETPKWSHGTKCIWGQNSTIMAYYTHPWSGTIS